MTVFFNIKMCRNAIFNTPWVSLIINRVIQWSFTYGKNKTFHWLKSMQRIDFRQWKCLLFAMNFPWKIFFKDACSSTEYTLLNKLYYGMWAHFKWPKGRFTLQFLAYQENNRFNTRWVLQKNKWALQERDCKNNICITIPL